MLMYQISLKREFFPNDYWNSFEKSEEKLLTKEKFNNTLTDQAIIDKTYENIHNIWKMDTMKDYNEIYLKGDVLLLNCAIKTFEKESIN